MKPTFSRAVLCGIVSVQVASCRPSADVQSTDLRTYTVPRQASGVLDTTATAGLTGTPETGDATTSSPKALGGPGLTYDVPDGWTDMGPGGMRLATLRTGPEGGADSGEISIIPASGTLEGNAARWQEQLTPGSGREGLARAIEEAERIPVNGVEATVLLLMGESAENQQAILAAMIPLDASTSLFVKFKGSADLARRLHGPFSTFVRSIRWK